VTTGSLLGGQEHGHHHHHHGDEHEHEHKHAHHEVDDNGIHSHDMTDHSHNMFQETVMKQKKIAEPCENQTKPYIDIQYFNNSSIIIA
jgi:hypothetical protein